MSTVSLLFLNRSLSPKFQKLACKTPGLVKAFVLPIRLHSYLNRLQIQATILPASAAGSFPASPILSPSPLLFPFHAIKPIPMRTAGSIPGTWSNTTSLQNVDVSNNRLSGTLPPSWSDLSGARYLNFSANSIGGTIPTGWRNSSTGNGTVDQGMQRLQYMWVPCTPPPPLSPLLFSPGHGEPALDVSPL